MSKAYEELIDFIAAETDPQKMIAFQPSEETRARVWELIHREKNEGLTADEKLELDHFGHLEHIFRVAKARAHARLAQIASPQK